MKKTEKLKSFKKWTVSHKKTVGCIVIVILVCAYFGYQKYTAVPAATKYVLSTVKKGTVSETVTGTGQVTSSNQVDLASKVSGNVVAVNARVGQEVPAGFVIARLDGRDAAFELESAKISYDHLVTIDPLDISKAENTLKNADETLASSYNDARSALAQASIDMRDAREGIAALYDKSGYLSAASYTSRDSGYSYRERGGRSADIAADAIKVFMEKYVSITKETSPTEIESILGDAYNTARSISQAAKDTKDAVAFIRDHEKSQNTIADNALTSANSMTTLTTGTVDSLLSMKDTIEKNKRSRDEAKSSLEKLKKGPDLTDIRASQLSIRQKEKAYQDYFITAPIDGIVAKVSVSRADLIGSGAAVATLISKQKFAEISLNEIDAAKVVVGQDAILTFDALPGVTLNGKVAEFDLVGVVSQGVVSYTVKISFNSDDDRIRPGMSVSSVITTASKKDVLVVSSSAVKTQGRKSYVEVVDSKDMDTIAPDSQKQIQGNQGVTLTTPPHSVEVETGLVGDEGTEILSGLNEGEKYVLRSIIPSATTASAAPTIFSAAGATGGNRTGGTGVVGGGNNAARLLR